MSATFVLVPRRRSPAFRKACEAYYSQMGKGGDFIAAQRRRWRKHGNTIILAAQKGRTVAGWILYDPDMSMIREICTNPSWTGVDPKPEMVDALIAKENLVAAEIVSDDTEAYAWMIGYGFRPTRHYVLRGTSMIRMDLSTSVMMAKLKTQPPSRLYEKVETVVIERVNTKQTYEDIRAALVNVFDKLGGMERFVKRGSTVVIKPNIVSDHGLKDGVVRGGIVTDKRVVKALVELLLPLAGKVIIGEGSSINRSETTKMFRHYGYDELVALDPDRVHLVDLNTDRLVEKKIPGGKRMISRKVPVTIDEADVVISVPVMKIHFAAKVSLAIKNLQGAMPPLEKYMTHFFGLWQNLVNIHYVVKPDLIIVDGLVGQEDFGPISGTPKEMNLLIAGTNPVAVDAVTMEIMGLDPLSSPPVWIAYMNGLGPVDPALITIKGSPVNEVKNPFREPVIDISGGNFLDVYDGQACSGCRGYLHFVLSKLRKPDPQDSSRSLIDRPFEKKVSVFLGPSATQPINPDETNIFLGICQQHNAFQGKHLPGCPPHAEVLMDGIFGLFDDVERPGYADKSEEARLGEMLDQVLKGL